MANALTNWISGRILRYLQHSTGRYAPFFAPDIAVMRDALRPCDVVLVEGNTRLSAIIKHLTQSTWSHAALYIGDACGPSPAGSEARVLLEADAQSGVAAVPLSKYAAFNTRICRPIGLNESDRQRVIDYAVKRLGMQYDSRQVVDLARYLFPYPPVPVALRRRMLAIGSGDPTRAICSTLIGEAFSSIHYPILPEWATIGGKSYAIAPFVQAESAHIRRHGLFTPRDFDVSPYFKVIKPQFAESFDFHDIEWTPHPAPESSGGGHER
jgi:hypothetical protein